MVVCSIHTHLSDLVLNVEGGGPACDGGGWSFMILEVPSSPMGWTYAHTLKDTFDDGICVISQQLCFSNGSQGEVTRHVSAQLLIAPLKELHCHWDSQGHHRRAAVILQKHEEALKNKGLK